jgi:hypothetical protein
LLTSSGTRILDFRSKAMMTRTYPGTGQCPTELLRECAMTVKYVTLLPRPPSCSFCRERMRYVVVRSDKTYPSFRRALFVCNCGSTAEEIIVD